MPTAHDHDHDPEEIPQPSRRDRKRARARAKARAKAEATAARRGMAPILGGVAIDLVDIVSVVGLGGVGGALVGGVITYAVCARQGVGRLATAALTLMGAVYCLLPFTEALPLATLVAVIWKLLPAQRALPPSPGGFEPAFEPAHVIQSGPARR